VTLYFPLNNIVFPSQQYRISLIRNSQDLTLWSYNSITPEMFRNNNFVKSKNVNILYFEAGPPGYIYLSASGVNANADFTQNGVSLITKKYKQ
jgi:hypothetical protein